MLFVDSDYNWIFLFFGFVYYFIIFRKYRNTDARHKYETETKNNVSNLKMTDNFIESKKGLSNSRIDGANNTSVSGQAGSVKSSALLSENNLGNKALNILAKQSGLGNIVKDSINKKSS